VTQVGLHPNLFQVFHPRAGALLSPSLSAPIWVSAPRARPWGEEVGRELRTGMGDHGGKGALDHIPV
jgi:hypothetical protein